MHGMVFLQLQQFVTKNYGHEAWTKLLNDSGIGAKFYMPTQIYSDDEAIAIVSTASGHLSLSPAAILESFGEYLAPNLIKIYAASIKPEWKALDLIEQTENTMHKAVKFTDKNASPPSLVCKRVASNKVSIHYNSSRKMIDLGIGIIKGFGKHYKENLMVTRTETSTGTTLEVTKVG
jgi:hypothetical protein